MKLDVVPPGSAGKEMDEWQSAEEKVSGTDKPSTSEDQGKNTENVECGSPAAEKHRTPDDKWHTLDHLVTGKKSTASQTTPLSIPVHLGCSDILANQAEFQHPSDSSISDVDCLVCFNQYSWSRPPKVLSCQHVFCAVCLKLMLRNEDNAWRIACPVCRKVTTVFGGLICSLPDKMSIMYLTDPRPAEMPFSQDALSGTLVIHSTFSASQGEEHSDRVAAKRLLFLLLLLVILIVFTLPFVYGGLMKWVLCVAVALGLIGVGVLCCNPNWHCSCSNTSALFWRTSMSHLAA